MGCPIVVLPRLGGLDVISTKALRGACAYPHLPSSERALERRWVYSCHAPTILNQNGTGNEFVAAAVVQACAYYFILSYGQAFALLGTLQRSAYCLAFGSNALAFMPISILCHPKLPRVPAGSAYK